MNKLAYQTAAVGLALFLAASIANTQQTADSLKQGFENPPASARPRVWWHWMNGNITKEGIRLDLEWMHRIGLAGFQNFDAALDTPQVVPQRLGYMTPAWKDAFKYAIRLGDQYGFEMAIAGSPGWSESGGPWVKPQEGMKKYVWSETEVKGGKPFHGVLVHPPTNTGEFQNYMRHELIAGGKEFKQPIHYADAAVVAFRRPASDLQTGQLRAEITGSSKDLNPVVLSDGNLNSSTGVAIPPVGQIAWIQYEYPRPATIRALTFLEPRRSDKQWAAAGTSAPIMALEASDDAKSWRHITDVSETPFWEIHVALPNTIAFPAVMAKYFRVTFKRTPPPLGVSDGDSDAAPTTFDLAELVMHSGARVNRWETKAGFQLEGNLYKYTTPSVAPSDAIAKSDVIDLTGKMSSDGTLDWTPPSGDWVILRLGYSLLGVVNHPAPADATGLEVDKLERRYVRSYFEKYLDSYKNTVGVDEMGRKGIRYVVNDSWEAGAQNWTDRMLTQFARLRGYDPVPWLPVLAGHVVDSAEASDRFLWDFRKTIADLVTTEHYGELETILHEHGMGHYGESHEYSRALPGDGMEVKKMDEVPMSAMWTSKFGSFIPQYHLNADDRESASVAHIYGQNIAAAESLTAGNHPWAWSPSTLKSTADQEFLNGINRFVIHESTHQPLTDPKKVPGLTLGHYGQWFNRNETWAEQASAWIDYLSRTSYLLQQGHFCADIIYFYGEDSNLTAIFSNSAPPIPVGYGFDYINADALIHELSVHNGAITTKSGMSYKILTLDPNSRHMSLPVLKAIRKLVEEGALIVGAKPVDDPSLADDQAEFKQLSDQLFADGAGTHVVGKGKVYAGQKLDQVLAALHLPPDFRARGAGAAVEFVHRKLAGGDLYFVDNRSEQTQVVNAEFRIIGKVPELWYAEDGRVKPTSFTIANGHTSIPLTLEPWGTVFVVFRRHTSEVSHVLPAVRESQVATLVGPWNIAFQPDRGAPASITVDKLASWTESTVAGVKYFSGTGTYTKSINADANWFTKGATIYLDLGDVKNIAEVKINGKNLGIVWHAPYRVDATNAFKLGANLVQIKVVNTWVNRIIGDQQPGATRYTFTTTNSYKATSPLLSSGLLGPVNVIKAERR
jgi:hypothetical protein